MTTIFNLGAGQVFSTVVVDDSGIINLVLIPNHTSDTAGAPGTVISPEVTEQVFGKPLSEVKSLADFPPDSVAIRFTTADSAVNHIELIKNGVDMLLTQLLQKGLVSQEDYNFIYTRDSNGLST